MNLEGMIRYETEGTCLDFKSEEYNSKNRDALIKDIMSMANAHTLKSKYIIIGVKDEPGKARKFLGLESISDQANLENIIQENIEPHVHFKYYSYQIDEKMLGIIEIFNNDNRPYMLKKDGVSIKKGDMFIRKGSRQSKALREDIDKMFASRSEEINTSNIHIGFNNTIQKQISIESPIIEESELPSSRKKNYYYSMLDKLEKYNSGDIVQQNIFLNPFMKEYDKEKQAIKIGTNDLGLPIYKNKEEIEKYIEKIRESYVQEDNYFCYEEKSFKLNFSILNDSNKFLEDVVIKFRIPSSDLLISEELPQRPTYNRYDFSHLTMSNSFSGYPYVEKILDEYIVEETFDTIRHKEITTIFSEDLRCLCTSQTIKKTITINYFVSAKNLSYPIEGELLLTIS
ncbi:helix-turn-helix domain-containing protein [Streptococcus uberis]|uniref:AlbA family DNA-binding domain-containing protein n=1 Tax=Streptococcus uberis TaxID=1349 RepID=UPI001939ACDA|nr:ATP-binding protein [Streptococcus uberis]